MRVVGAHAHSRRGQSLALVSYWQSWQQYMHMYTVLSHDLTVQLGKPWTLEISQESLLCYDQSQQRSGHANWPQNHKLTDVLACGLVFSWLIGFSLAGQQYSTKISGVHGFPGLIVIFLLRIWSIHDCMVMKELNGQLKWGTLPLFLQQVQKPCDVCLFGNLLLCLVRSKLFLKN